MMRMDPSGKKMILNRLVRCKPEAGEMKETLPPTENVNHFTFHIFHTFICRAK